MIAIGASLLGAKKIYGVDIDEDALETARRNIERMNLENIILLKEDVSAFSSNVDTVLMNPPFGCQVRNADRPFLEKACEIGNVVYLIHLTDVRKFIEEFVEREGFKVRILSTLPFEIPGQFFFHKKRLERIEVDLYRIYDRN